jgi:HAD superfamily hydrolase (TIGR01549 family)
VTRLDGRVDAVVFDLDGTLVDTSDVVPASYAACVRELAGRTVSEKDVVANFGATPDEALATLLGRATRPEDFDCFDRHLVARLSAVRLYDAVEPMLAALGRSGMPFGIFTGASRRAAERVLEHTGLSGRAPLLVAGDEVASAKPAPDGILDACSRLDVRPARTAYVGDSHNDMAAARAAGAIACAAAWGDQYGADVGQQADLVVGSPDDLLRALSPTGRPQSVAAGRPPESRTVS